MKFARIATALALPLLLCSCFLIPGAFNASMDLRKDGTFTFAYKGEIIFQSPDEVMKDGKSKNNEWSEKKARCYKEGDPYYDRFGLDSDEGSASAEKDENERPCTSAELAKLKKDFDAEQAERVAKDKREADQFAAVFGFNPGNDEANRKLAAQMMKYDGWKSVTYKGKGVFDVDYSLTSKAGHDFVFPLIPQSDTVIPFVAIRPREGGAVAVNAPALMGGGIRALAARMRMLGLPSDEKDMPGPSSVTKGTFTLTTDGEILTNNTEEGPTSGPRGKTLVWEISPSSEKIPEALIKLR